MEGNYFLVLLSPVSNDWDSFQEFIIKLNIQNKSSVIGSSKFLLNKLPSHFSMTESLMISIFTPHEHHTRQ